MMAFLRLGWAVLIGFSLTSQVSAQSIEEVQKSLLKDIQQAQARLNRLENKVGEETRQLSLAIQKRQREVMALKEKAVVHRRQLDDQTLALSDIQSRLEKWQQQDNYQKRLLMDLAGKDPANAEWLQSIHTKLENGLPLLEQTANRLKQSVSPTWRNIRVLLPDGSYQPAELLKVGPTNWFYQPVEGRGGLLNDKHEVQLIFDASATNQLGLAFAGEQALLTLDPTLGSATKLHNQQESVFQHVERGGVWVVPIVGFGLFALLIALLKAWQLFRLPKLQPLLSQRIEMAQRDQDVALRLQNLLPNLKGAQAALVEITLNTPMGEQRDDRLLAYLLDYRQQLQARLGAIAVTASVAPLLGLLGTVSGMIETFNMMNLFGSGDPAVVSGGISKALITTELGLVVAIPALVTHALLNRYIRRYHTELDNTAIRLGKLSTECPAGADLPVQAA